MSKKKTIWIFNEYAGSPYHGMEYRHYYIGKELINRGYDVYIISASYSHLFSKMPEVKRDFTYEDIDGIKYLWVKVPKYEDSHDKKRIIKWFYYVTKTYFFLPFSHLQLPEVIIVSSIAPFSIVSGYRWAKKFRAQLVYEVKDIWPLSLIELGGYSAYHPFIKFMGMFERFAYRKADKVVSVLPYAYEHMQKQGLDISKFVYIPNGFCVSDYKEETPPKEILHQLPKDGFKIVYAGTMGRMDALDYLILAADRLKNCKDIYFILVGKGSNKNKILNMARSMNLKNVIFIPFIPKSQVLSLIKKCDVCYIGWKKREIYKFGISANKIFDYMFAEKPILHSFSGRGDLIKLAKCGITVESENPIAISEGILHFYRMSKEEREKLGKNGKNYLLDYHTYKVITNKFEKIIKLEA